MGFEFSLIIPAFIAGILTFLAPCTLPLVPGYLGFISGTSMEDLKDPEKSKKARMKIFLNGLMFILGFSLVFIVLGSLTGLAGSALSAYRVWLARIGGVFVIFFGLFMMHIIKIPFLNKEARFKAPGILKQGKLSNSFTVGTAFGFGWTPCVGPILGTILTLAAASGTIFQGAILLAVFSAGLAIPFLAIALGIGSAAKYINRFSKYLNAISIIGGVFLIFLGVLMVTDSFALWFSYFYQAFDFINYDRLLDFL